MGAVPGQRGQGRPQGAGGVCVCVQVQACMHACACMCVCSLQERNCSHARRVVVDVLPCMCFVAQCCRAMHLNTQAAQKGTTGHKRAHACPTRPLPKCSRAPPRAGAPLVLVRLWPRLHSGRVKTCSTHGAPVAASSSLRPRPVRKKAPLDAAGCPWDCHERTKVSRRRAQARRRVCRFVQVQRHAAPLSKLLGQLSQIESTAGSKQGIVGETAPLFQAPRCWVVWGGGWSSPRLPPSAPVQVSVAACQMMLRPASNKASAKTNAFQHTVCNGEHCKQQQHLKVMPVETFISTALTNSTES